MGLTIFLRKPGEGLPPAIGVGGVHFFGRYLAGPGFNFHQRPSVAALDALLQGIRPMLRQDLLHLSEVASRPIDLQGVLMLHAWSIDLLQFVPENCFSLSESVSGVCPLVVSSYSLVCLISSFSQS